MVFRARRKRLRLSQLWSEEESPEQVGEFDPEQSSDSDFEEAAPVATSQDLVPSTGTIRVCKRNNSGRSQSWVERYSSIDAQSGTASSSRKAKEIASWVNNAFSGSLSRLLVLAGPPGCGKTSAIRYATKELGCQVQEWHAPATGPRNISMTLLEDFRSFFVAGRYSGLNLEGDVEMGRGRSVHAQKILLVRDLPLSETDILQKRGMLQSIFSDAARFAPYPTVVVVSDSEKGIARAARMLLGSELLESSAVSTIKVPPVTAAMMRRRLREVLALEGFSMSPDELEAVVASAQGDIRAALNGLQFSASAGRQGRFPTTNGSQNAPTRRRNSKRKRHEPLQNLFVVNNVRQDTTLSTYHAVAKILNNKQDESGLSAHSAEDVLEDARADPASFLAFLHHNYPGFFGDLDDAVDALDCLSDADCLLTWRQDDLARTGLGDCAASVVTRGFLQHNRSPIRTGWRPIRGPEFFAVAREGRDYIEEARQRFSRRLSPLVCTRAMLCETVPFAEQITRHTIKPWGTQGNGYNQARIPTSDAADVAMVDIEAAQDFENIPVVSQSKGSQDGSGFSTYHDDVEDIEEWD